MTHWTGRMLAKSAGVSLRSVQRILEANQLAPHRIRTCKLSNDPNFAQKLKDIVGLYVDPPAHAVVLSIDEKSQIQALDRPTRDCRWIEVAPAPWAKTRSGNTTTLFAALNVLDGTVVGRNIEEFIRFRNTIEAQVPKRKAIMPLSTTVSPETSQSKPMAGAVSALDVPLHADQRLWLMPWKASSPSSARAASRGACSTFLTCRPRLTASW
jgi:hypothetical protein